MRLLLWLPRSTEPSQGQRFGIAARSTTTEKVGEVCLDG